VIKPNIPNSTSLICCFNNKHLKSYHKGQVNYWILF